MRAALNRKESRGGHSRVDYPQYDPKLEKLNIVIRKKQSEMEVVTAPLPEMPAELKELFKD